MKRITIALIIATLLITSESSAQNSEKSYDKYVHTVLLDDYLFTMNNTPLVLMVRNMVNDIWTGKMAVYKAENVWAGEFGQYLIDSSTIVSTTISEVIKPYSRTDSFQDPNSGKYIQSVHI